MYGASCSATRNSQGATHRDTRAEAREDRILRREPVGDQPVVRRPDLDEALRRVEGAVPRDVTVGGEGELVVAAPPRPVARRTQQRPPETSPAVVGLH